MGQAKDSMKFLLIILLIAIIIVIIVIYRISSLNRIEDDSDSSRLRLNFQLAFDGGWGGERGREGGSHLDREPFQTSFRGFALGDSYKLQPSFKEPRKIAIWRLRRARKKKKKKKT